MRIAIVFSDTDVIQMPVILKARKRARLVTTTKPIRVRRRSE